MLCWMAGGLVRVSSFAVLPNIEAGHCALLALVAMLPMLAAVWRRPQPRSFAGAVAYACLCRCVEQTHTGLHGSQHNFLP